MAIFFVDFHVLQDPVDGFLLDVAIRFHFNHLSDVSDLLLPGKYAVSAIDDELAELELPQLIFNSRDQLVVLFQQLSRLYL